MRKSRIVSVIVLLAAFIGIIIWFSLNTYPFLTVSQVVNHPEHYDNKEIQVSGIVEDYIDDKFDLTEDNDKIKIIPDGIKIPKDVENGSEIVVQGVFDASKVLLKVNEILTYCCDRAPEDNN